MSNLNQLERELLDLVLQLEAAAEKAAAKMREAEQAEKERQEAHLRYFEALNKLRAERSADVKADDSPS